MPVLVIRDELTQPPSWFASYRDLTLYCTVFLNTDVVVEVNGNFDPTYRWLRQLGGMDFVKQLVSPETQSGVRLETVLRAPHLGRTILTDRIAIENIHRLIGRIRGAI